MGFKRKQRVYRLEFAVGPLAGFEVQTRVPRLDQVEAIGELANVKVVGTPTSEDISKLRKFCEAMAECIVEWNLEDEDGTPIPCTKGNLLAQDLEFLMPLAAGWMQAIDTGPDDRELTGESTSELELPDVMLPPSVPLD